jgi:hypothetical protein
MIFIGIFFSHIYFLFLFNVNFNVKVGHYPDFYICKLSIKNW